MAITQKDIEAGLRELGLQSGDIVLLHSSLASLGFVEGGAEAVVKAFLAVLGEEGTLLAPTFGALGILTEVIRAHPRAVKSVHPFASVAAIGKDAERLCREHWKAETAHGEDTPYTRIAESGGHVCLLGVDQDRNTTLHSVEAILRLPYLKRTREVRFDTPEGPHEKSWPFFPGPHRNFMALDPMLRASGKMTLGRIGRSVVRLIKSRDLLDLCREAGRRDPAFILCDNPNCADCVAQRAALRRARLAGETFRLAAAASLAGRYVPEMVENLRAAGVDALELDVIQGQLAGRLSEKRLRAAVEEFREAGIAAGALRFPVVDACNEKRLDLFKACGIERLVLPLSHLARDWARAAGERGIAVSFFNAQLGSDAASALLLELKAQNLSAGFTFNAAHFARAGEKPFSKSYKKKLRRFVDQLDVEDAASDGRPVALERGHAEIKELVSILRCASFEGFFVLGSGNRALGTLRDAAGGFMRLLDGM